MQWVILLLFCGFVQANTDGTVFLERGQRGIVPCPLVESRKIPPGDVVAMYWYYGSTSDTSLLISYFFGSVAPQNGIPEGVYDIDDEFSLVIENVTASNEGTYYFLVKPRLKMIEEGQVEVCGEGLLQPTVRVIGCDKNNDHEDTCEARVQRDTAVLNLTCVTEHVKPAVELRWIRVLGDGLTEINASTTVRPVVLPAYTGSSYMSNTHSRSVSIQVPAVDDDTEYVCQAIDVTEGGGAHMKVRFTKTNPTTATYDEVQTSNNPGVCIQANTDGIVFLERSHRGIVPCPLIKSRQISPENVDAMYWYYGSISRTPLLISYFLGRVAPQNGIPEGVYDIDNEFNLIIESVTASNEGTFYFQVKPHLKMIEEGQVGVCEKVSPSRPYPTVIGCNQDHDADTCEMRVRHDSTVHNLNCVMEQVKPAIELRWIRLFLGGLTELSGSTTVRPVVLPAYTGACVQANTDGAVFLERGQRGIVPCPLVKSRQIPPGDVDAMYWYYGSISMPSMLISYTRGRVYPPPNGIPEGVYDIDNEFNLVIENVTASNEGTFYFQVKPHLKMIEEGKVGVCEKGLSLRNNTYSTSASVQVAAVDDEEVYACEAMGVVVGKGAHMIVRIANIRPTTTIHDDEARSSNNPGTTLVTADVSPTACNHVGLLVTVLVVVSLILVISNVILCTCIRHQNKKLKEFNRTSKMRPDIPAAIDPSSKEEATGSNPTQKLMPDAPVEIDPSSEEEATESNCTSKLRLDTPVEPDYSVEFHLAPKSYVSVQFACTEC